MPPLKKFAKPIPVSALPAGFRGAGVTCGLKPSGKPDLALFVSDASATAAVTLTQNQFAAAPIHITREHAKGGRARALVINSGNANAATGSRGLADARQMCAIVAAGFRVKARDVLVNSTGVIGVPLPMDKLEHGISEAMGHLSPAGINGASEAMMTTDALPKRTWRQWQQERRPVRLVVTAKGVGMIHPNMATMIGVALTDAAISAPLLRRALREAVGESFNCLSVDGDTSTNDMVAILANGAAGAATIDKRDSSEYRGLVENLTSAFQDMALAMASDGEGASRVAIITVRGARTGQEARTLAHAVGTSSLFKTAIHGADPNWGRIAMALGNSGVEFDPSEVTIRVAGTTLLRKGRPVKFDKRDASRAMAKDEVAVDIEMGLGKAQARVWSSALTEEYVRFNSAYTT